MSMTNELDIYVLELRNCFFSNASESVSWTYQFEFKVALL